MTDISGQRKAIFDIMRQGVALDLTQVQLILKEKYGIWGRETSISDKLRKLRSEEGGLHYLKVWDKGGNNFLYQLIVNPHTKAYANPSSLSIEQHEKALMWQMSTERAIKMGGYGIRWPDMVYNQNKRRKK